ncbi:MAG: tetratricopeptide repeat protein [Planctomycetes bacterium]|nr:tetratricopeptide repeat protein [Planctomycetota bacterium]
MKNVATGLIATCLIASIALAQAAPSSPPPQADKLGAQSLRRDALSLIYAPASTPARASRLVALARMAHRLEPDNPEGNRLLAVIYQSQGRLEDLKGALDICHRADPQDHVLGMQWLQLNLDLMATAQDRIDFLNEFVKRDDVTGELRAEAAVALAETYRGQGDKNRARNAIEMALKLNPRQPQAVFGVLAHRENVTVEDEISAALAVLAGSPRRTDQAHAVGTLLGELGLHEQALRFFEHGWTLAKQSQSREVMSRLGPSYASTLLDAGRAEEALSVLTEAMRYDPYNTDLRSLLIETNQALGRHEDASLATNELENILKARETTGSPAYARDLAWFYLLTQPRPERAMAYIRGPASVAADDPVVIRILGISELLTGNTSAGEERLLPLVSTDAYAALFLAERYFKSDRIEQGKAVLAQGASAARSGPGFRRLKILADLHGVELGEMKHAAEAAALAERFDFRVLEMCRKPGDFLELGLEAESVSLAVGDNLYVKVTLTNKSPIAAPLGLDGIINPQVAFVASIAGIDAPLANLPIALLPAPASLAPGQSVSTVIRLDVGRMSQVLAQRPTDEFPLVIAAVPDAMFRENRVISRAQGLEAKPVAIKRLSVLPGGPQVGDDQWKKAYELYLGHLSWFVQYGQVEQKMKTARQLAAMLDYESQISSGAADVTPARRSVISRQILLRLMVELLKDPSDVVRAEMLSAQTKMQNDYTTLKLLGARFDDPSPLVRLRLAELLGIAGGQNTVMDYLAQDKDEDVRMMANALMPSR